MSLWEFILMVASEYFIVKYPEQKENIRHLNDSIKKAVKTERSENKNVPLDVKYDTPAEEDDAEETVCIVCTDNRRCVVFKPCSHSSTCIACAIKINNCPICRVLVTEKIFYFSS